MRKFFKIFALLVSLTGLSIWGGDAVAAIRTSTAAGGAWATGTTWVGGVAPVAGDTVVIATTGASTVTVGAAATIAGVTINNGATLTMTTFALTVNGPWVNNGTFTPGTATITFGGATAAINAGTGTANFNILRTATTATALAINTPVTAAALTTQANAAAVTITINGTNTLTVSGAVTIARPATGGTTTLAVGAGTLSAGSLALQGTTTPRIAAVTVSTGTVTVTGNFTASGTANPGGSQFTFTGAGTLNVGGATTNAIPQTTNAWTFTPSTSTVNFTAAGPQTVGAATFNDLILSGSGTKTMGASTIQVNGTTTVTGTATLNVSSATGAKTFIGAVVVDPNCSFTNTANEVITFRGGITHNGTTFTSGTGIYTFDTNNQAIDGTGTVAIQNVTVTGVVLTNNGTLDISTNLAGTGELVNGATGTLLLGDTTSTIATLTATAVGNTVNYDRAGNQTVYATTYHHLEFSNSGVKAIGATTINGNFTMSGNATTAPTGALAVGGNFTIGAGTTFTAGAFNHTVGGDWSETGTFTPGTGTVTFNGAAAQTISGTNPVAFNNLTVTNAASPNITLATNVTVAGTLTGTVTLTSTCPTDYTLTSTTPAQVLHSCSTLVNSIVLANANPTNAATVSWTVTFSRSATGVDATAFSLVPGGGLSGTFITTVTGSGTTWTVTANTGIGSGTLGLNQTGPGSVVPTLAGTFTGQVFTITATPALAEYRMDEALWNGIAGQVVDSSGSGNNAQAFNSASTAATTPAITGSPGTCRYGVFDNGTTITNGYVQTPLPNLTTDFTITAWMRSTNTATLGQRILVDDLSVSNGYGFSFSDAGAGVLRFYSRGITPIILDSTYTIAANTWYFVAAVADITNRKRTIYVFNAAGTLLNSTSDAAAFTGTWTADAGPVMIGGTGALHFVGNLDEVRVYQKALNQNALAAIAAQTHSCALLDHYELSLPTSSITCLPTTATVTACADASSPCTNPLTAASGTTASLATNGGTLGLTTVTFSTTGTVSTTLSYPAAPDGTGVSITLSGEQITATNNRQCCPNGTSCVIANSCSTTFNTAGFIFSGTAGGTGLTIPSQTAGVSSPTCPSCYYLRAVKTSTTTQACESALQGSNVAVDFGYECNNPTTCSGSIQMALNGGNGSTSIAGTNNGSGITYSSVGMNFDANGNAPFTFNFSDVGQIKLYARKAASGSLLTTLTGSSNAFIVKPYSMVLTDFQQTASPNTANPAAANASGSAFVKAGENFSATVTAVNATCAANLSTYTALASIPASCKTPNYGKETTTAEGVTMTNALVTGLGLSNNPAINNNTAFGAFAGGSATGTTFSWGEVGIITLTPSVGDGDYLGAGDVTGTTTGNIGRFYPDHFAITSPSIMAACSTGTAFTYFGQDGFTTAFTLTAQNASNATTSNYVGNGSSASWAKLPLTTWGAAPASAGSPGFGFAASIWVPSQSAGSSLAASATTPTAANWSAGTTTVTAKHKIVRSTAPAVPTTVTVTTLPVDSDGVTATSAAAIGSPLLRFGRLWLGNAYGSDNFDLAVPFEVQYWNGSAFVKNTSDGCALIASGNIALGNNQGGLSAYTGPITGSTASSGAGSITLTKPSSAAAGSVDLVVNLGSSGSPSNCPGLTGGTPAALSYLSGKWCGSNYDRDPTARATFGIYGSSLKKGPIYIRESY